MYNCVRSLCPTSPFTSSLLSARPSGPGPHQRATAQRCYPTRSGVGPAGCGGVQTSPASAVGRRGQGLGRCGRGLGWLVSRLLLLLVLRLLLVRPVVVVFLLCLLFLVLLLLVLLPVPLLLLLLLLRRHGLRGKSLETGVGGRLNQGLVREVRRRRRVSGEGLRRRMATPSSSSRSRRSRAEPVGGWVGEACVC